MRVPSKHLDEAPKSFGTDEDLLLVIFFTASLNIGP